MVIARATRGLALAVVAVLALTTLSACDPQDLLDERYLALSPGMTLEGVTYPNGCAAYEVQTKTCQRMRGLNVRHPIDPANGWLEPRANFDSIAAKGFDHVRLRIDPSVAIESCTNVGGDVQATLRPQFLGWLETLLDRTEAAGLVAIVDPLHFVGDSSNIPASCRAADAGLTSDHIGWFHSWGADVWVPIVTTFEDHQGVWAWDLVNEPSVPNPIAGNNLRLLDAYEAVGSAIRAVDSGTPMMIEPIAGGSSMEGADWSRLSLDVRLNTILSYHDYFGGCDVDGNAFIGWNDSGRVTGLALYDGYTDWDPTCEGTPSQLRSWHLQWRTWGHEAGMPVQVGEYGIGVAQPHAVDWHQAQLAIAQELGLSRTAWEYKWGPGMRVWNGSSWHPIAAIEAS